MFGNKLQKKTKKFGNFYGQNLKKKRNIVKKKDELKQKLKEINTAALKKKNLNEKQTKK